MNKVKKALCMVLALMLLLALVPVTALADGDQPGMVLGTILPEFGTNTEYAATVHYGGHAWRVIGYNGTGVASAVGNMTLLAAGNIGTTYFDNTSARSNIYGANTDRSEDLTQQDSALKMAVDAIAGQLSSGERGAVVPRDLAVSDYNEQNTDGISGQAVPGAVMWPLSTQEATQVNENIRSLGDGVNDWGMYYWGLRSPGRNDYWAANVKASGDVSYSGLGISFGEFGVRPAFHINIYSVALTSAATGGKSSGAEGAYALTEVSANTTNEWKLTIRDDAHQDFRVNTSEITFDSNTRTVTVPYTGAQISADGHQEYISAVIAHRSGEITYYGRIAEATTPSGSVSISVCDRLTTGDTLYVFNEQYNGDNATDYSSAFFVITLPSDAYGTSHIEVVDPALPATCTETGLTAGKHCSVCGEVLTAQQTVTALGHDWGNWTVTREAQPGTAGERQRTCQRDGCGEVETEVIPALPVYTVTQGADGSWTQGSGADLVITVTRSEDNANCFSHYTGTLIDGQPAAVSARSGSTIVTIPADVLERLGTGTHTVTVQFNDGEVNTQLTIKAAETQSNEETTAAETTAAETTAAETTAAETTAADPGRTPTGDSTRPGLWIGLACTAGIACAVAAVLMKKKRT